MPQTTNLDNYTVASHSAPAKAAAGHIPSRLRPILSLDDFEIAARKHLPSSIFAYVAGGCETDRSLKRNRQAFEDYDWIPQVFVDSTGRSLGTPLLGKSYAAPFGIAPMGICALSGYRGDIAQARASGRAGIPMILSGSSLIPMESVAAENPDAWFQAYVPGDEARIEKLVDRVENAGFRTLVVTVDVPVSGNRENNIRAGFSTPLRPGGRLFWDGASHPRWLFGTALRTLIRHGMPHFENTQATRGAPILSSKALRDFGARDHLSWHHFDLMRKRWRGTLIVKGLLNARDAATAREHGADAIIVSNHGGRQLDGAATPLDVLPAIIAAMGSDYPVMIDSGFRRGSEVLMALALGASFVFVGRPFNYAGAVAGEAGVTHAIGILASEIMRNMALIGIKSPAEAAPAHLYRRTRGT